MRSNLIVLITPVLDEHLRLQQRCEYLPVEQLVLGALSSGVRLTSITETEDQISLDGDADSSSEVIDYTAALEQTGGFSTVYVASLSGGGNGSLATFSIVCLINHTGATQ